MAVPWRLERLEKLEVYYGKLHAKSQLEGEKSSTF